MKLLPIVSVFGFLLIFTFCKKKEKPAPEDPAPVTTVVTPTPPSKPRTYDTIFPGSYFPVYPGSTWKYLDQNNNVVVTKTDSLYKLDYHQYSDTVYVPIFENRAISGYALHLCYSGDHYRYPFGSFVPILSETTAIGQPWVISQGYGNGGRVISRKVIAKDTTIIISGVSYYPTIITEDFFSSYTPFYVWTTRSYYTKNIGLIKETSNNILDSTITTNKVLMSYTINK